MSERFSEDEAIAAIPRLTRARLVAFIEADVVCPLRANTGFVFRRIDIARMQLLCELSDDLELDETALGVVISLIDQLHAARHDLQALARAIDAEPAEVRSRIGSALLGSRG